MNRCFDVDVQKKQWVLDATPKALAAPRAREPNEPPGAVITAAHRSQAQLRGAQDVKPQPRKDLHARAVLALYCAAAATFGFFVAASWGDVMLAASAGAVPLAAALALHALSARRAYALAAVGALLAAAHGAPLLPGSEWALYAVFAALHVALALHVRRQIVALVVAALLVVPVVATQLLYGDETRVAAVCLQAAVALAFAFTAVYDLDHTVLQVKDTPAVI